MVKKKMKLPFHHLFMKSTSTVTTTSWPWRPTCVTPKTLSFRAQNHNFLITHQLSSSSSPSSSQEQDQEKEEEEEGEAIVLELGDQDLVEKVVIRGLRSERLFFEPDETSSILQVDSPRRRPESDVIKNTTTINGGANSNHLHEEEEDILIRGFQESVVMAVLDSTDPFVDFRRSMQEMVEFSNHNNNKDWDFLEELLTCYLRVNGKNNHGYIVGAFVDLLVTLSLSSSSSFDPRPYDDHHHQDDCYYSSYSSSSSSSTITTTGVTNYSFTSPLSFSSSSSTTTTSPCLSILEVLDDDDGDDEIRKPNPSPPPPH